MTLRDLIAFSLLDAPRWRKSAALFALSAADPAHAAPDALDLLVAWCRPVETAALRRSLELRVAADEALERASRLGIQPIGLFDPRYPAALAAIPDPPAIVWVLGQPGPAALAGRLVAIVGSRRASAYGLEVAERLAYDLARAGVVVVSGLARGCDGAAHRGALAGGGPTVAVMGCGADVVYPRDHRALYDDIARAGAVISELPPGTPPLAWHFPLRNRVISGLVRAVVVVEASERSGSLITAACALEQGRDVMAVPGSIFGSRHHGSHALLRDGARLVQSAADVLDELGWGPRQPGLPQSPAAPDPLLHHLDCGEDCDLDTVVARSGLSAAAALSQLMALELAGFVKRVAGGRFLRADRH
jgi:DNA processing protein